MELTHFVKLKCKHKLKDMLKQHIDWRAECFYYCIVIHITIITLFLWVFWFINYHRTYDQIWLNIFSTTQTHSRNCTPYISPNRSKMCGVQNVIFQRILVHTYWTFISLKVSSTVIDHMSFFEHKKNLKMSLTID